MSASAEGREGNFEEEKVPAYVLPEVLVTEAGEEVGTVAQWEGVRRPELMGLFEQHVYGRIPEGDWGIAVEELEPAKLVLGGKAMRHRVQIRVPAYPAFGGIEMLVYRPVAVERAPVFVGLSFSGNHAVTTEVDVPISTKWMRPSKGDEVVEHRATEKARGASASRWPMEAMVDRGYAVATAYCGDMEPDHADGWKDGIRGVVAGADHEWVDGEWGCIAAWSWGLSRMLDALETLPGVDASRAAVLGHSRLGKTALWAGARDARFGLVISNNSGEGGAALKYRDFGETPKVITKSFPHWFTPTYASYGDDPRTCPVDQHELLALMAPRALYVASATGDEWADPKGEFLALVGAGPVYGLYGLDGVSGEVLPAADAPVGERVRYHLRTGDHDITAWDWARYADLADAVWGE